MFNSRFIVDPTLVVRIKVIILFGKDNSHLRIFINLGNSKVKLQPGIGQQNVLNSIRVMVLQSPDVSLSIVIVAGNFMLVLLHFAKARLYFYTLISRSRTVIMFQRIFFGETSETNCGRVDHKNVYSKED
jgi:hypothetical protein